MKTRRPRGRPSENGSSPDRIRDRYPIDAEANRVLRGRKMLPPKSIAHLKLRTQEGRRCMPRSRARVQCRREGVSDPTRRLQSRPRGNPMGSLTPSVSSSGVRWLQGCFVSVVASTLISDRGHSRGRTFPVTENRLISEDAEHYVHGSRASASCCLRCASAFPGRGHHVIPFWSDTRAHQASALRADPFGLRA